MILLQSLLATNFSEMSTQELLAIIGYVKPTEQSKFFKELEARKASMSVQEKAIYQEKLKQLQIKK